MILAIVSATTTTLAERLAVSGAPTAPSLRGRDEALWRSFWRIVFVSGLDRRLEPEGEVRRFEVINGAMGRRRWSADDRARILEETLARGAIVSAVTRRQGLTPQQLFTWRRAPRKQSEAEAPPTCVPAVVDASEHGVAKGPTALARRRAPRRHAAAIEMEASGVTVRVGDGTSPAMIAAVIRALKSAS